MAATKTAPLVTQELSRNTEKLAWTPSATYPEKPATYDDAREKITRALEHGRKHRRTVAFYGDHGIGKTSVVEAWCEDQELKYAYLNLANMTPDDALMTAPVRSASGDLSLRQLIVDDLIHDEPFALILDDARQASQKVQNQFMQLTNDWRIGQVELKNLVAVVTLDNEGAAEGIRTSEDLAVADRRITIRLAANDTGFRYALAAKYVDVDLTGVLEVWDSQPTSIRHTLSPRALDHVIYCVLNGFPPIWALPLIGDDRQRLVVDGNDRTAEVLRRICEALNRPYLEQHHDTVRAVVEATLRDGLVSHIQGPPGVGKTTFTRQIIAENQLKACEYSMPFTDPETLVVPLPTSEGRLAMLLAEELTSEEPFAIVWDEYNRPASMSAFAKLMEITQQWKLAGKPLTGLRGQIALSNPSEHNGQRMNVLKGNIAQADRFTISVQITEADIPATEWLLNSWPALPEPDRNGVMQPRNDGDVQDRKAVMAMVAEWYSTDLDDAQRQWVSKRTMQRLAELWLDEMPLSAGLMYLGEGRTVDVPLLDLEARLRAAPVTRLRQIVADIDTWMARLNDARDKGFTENDDIDIVVDAFQRAETSQIDEHRHKLQDLWILLPQRVKMPFITSPGPGQKYWTDFAKEVGARQADNLPKRAAHLQ